MMYTYYYIVSNIHRSTGATISFLIPMIIKQSDMMQSHLLSAASFVQSKLPAIMCRIENNVM